MMIEIKIPSPGESVTEVEIAVWFVQEGDQVEKDQEIAEIESDKATLPLLAPESGKVVALVPEGEMVPVGSVACKIDTGAKGKMTAKTGTEVKTETKAEAKSSTGEKESDRYGSTVPDNIKNVSEVSAGKIKVTPVAGKMMEELNLSVEDIIRGLRKITKKDVELVVSGSQEEESPVVHSEQAEVSRETEKIKISQFRRKLSERLVSIKNETAMLTTFNEVDMSEVIMLRKKYQSRFREKHGVKLGFMSFFTKAATLALKSFPQVNSMIDGNEYVHFKYADIGIAVQTGKGLIVPVIRNTETLSMAKIEQKILELADKARRNRISIEDMSGGTFTITNGGIFGAMLSTPILNPPQAAILGMHNIVERPVAVNGKVDIRPVMYLALSYDHRIIDGRDSVGFLVKVKELIESPVEMLPGGNKGEELLLGLE